MKRAINPQTGEVVFLVNDEWVSPSQTAVNEAGDKAYLVGNEWYVPPVPAAPTLSPEEQMMAPIGADTTGGIELSDYGKLFGAGAVKSTLGAPEAIQAGTSGIARDTATKPTEILNYLSDPRKLANDLAQAVRLPKIFEDEAKLGIVPEKTAEKQKAAIDEALTKGKLQSLRDLTAYGTKVAERIEDSVTPEMKEALADSQPTGNIIEALETGDFSKISLGKDPSLAGIVGQAAKVFGSTAPAILTAVVSKSPTVGGIAGFGQAGSEGVEAAREHIKSMSNEELAEKSEYFRNLLALGYKPDVARKMTEEKAADTAAYYQGMVGALGNQFTANLIKGNLDDVLLASAKSRLAKIVKGTAAGMTEEGLQELAEGIATDLGIDRTVVREMGVDSFANVVLGAIGGGAPGGFRGAISKDKTAPEEKPTETPEVRPNVTPVTPEGTPVATAPEVTPAATTPPAPPAAPVSGAISAEELETAETPVEAKTNEVMMPVVDQDGNVTEDMDKVDLNNVFVEDGKVWVRGEEWDHDLMSVLEELKDEDQKMALVKRAEELMPKAEEPALETPKAEEVPEVKDDAIRLIKLQRRFMDAESGKVITKPQANQVYKLMEKEQIDKAEALLDKFLKLAEERKAKEAPKATEVLKEEEVKAATAPVEEEERVLTPDEVDAKYAGASKQVDRIKELSNIGDEDRTDEENDFLDAARRELYRTAERISGPPRKKGYVSSSHIDVNQFGDKWVSGSTYMGSTGGYGVGVSYDSTPYDTREEAINAEIDKMRSYAESQKDTVTLKWLDSLDKRKPKVLTKEEKAAENRKRQEEKKRASQQVAEEESEDEDEDADESGTYDITKDKDAEVILSPNSNVKLFVKEITDPKYPEYVGKWLYDSQIKTNGGSMFGGKTPKSSPISAANRKDAIKKSLEKAQSQEFYLNKKGKRDQSIEDFVQSIAKKEGIDLESYDQREERYKKEAAEKKAAEKAEANRKRQEEKKAKAAAEKEAAKKKEDEDFQREMEERRARESAIYEQSQNEFKRTKEIEKIKITELEDTEGIPARELKEFKDKVEEAADAYYDATKAYIKTGKGKDSIDDALVEYEKAIKEFNAEVAEIRGEEAAEEAPKAKEKPRAKRTYKRDILTKAVDIYELDQSLQNIGETDNKTISDFTDKEIVDEAKYILSTFNEEGHANNDALIGEAGPEGKKDAQQQVNKLKQLIKKYEVKEAPKAEVKEEPKAAEEKPAGKLVPALPLSQEWATGRDYEITPEKVGQEVYDYYEKMKSGDFGFTSVSYTGANALKRANQANKENKANYDKAARLFLGRTITTKTPTKKQAKIQVPDGLFVTPLPVAKQIKDVAKSVEDQKAAMFDITAPKDEVRMALKGVLVEPDTIVATDGHRMAILTAKTGVKKDVILDKDGKEIDSSYPNYKMVAKKASDVEANIGVNAIALGDYARGVSKAAKFIIGDNALPLSLNNKLYSFNAKYVEDMTNLFRKFGYDEFFINVGEDKMLVAKSPDNKLVQYIMGMRDNQNVFMPFDVLAGEPGVNRPEVIEGEGIIREITSREVKLIKNATSKLSDSEIAKLEEAYGIPNYSMDFAKRIREDAIKYINEGAEAVDKAIRSIISKVAAAILSVAIVFNPNFMSDASAVVIPQQVVEVRAEVPKDASGMSDAGKKAYATLYPALKQGLQKNNKYFTVVDKPTSQMFVFNPDGSMLLKSNVLLGSQFGDTYVGQTDFKQNRMTPAGLFKPKAEKGSATYDGKTVYTFGNVKEGWNAVFMHSVYLKAGDAEARLKALETGDKTRLSYGCVNGPDAVMEKLDNQSMDESHVFIVPDNQAAVDDYIANRVSNEDLTRETVKPATTKVPSQRAKAMSEQEVFGREEELPLEPKKTQAEINRDRQKAKKAVAESKDKTIFYGNFTGNLSEEDIKAMNREVRDEKIIEVGKITRKITNLDKKIAQVGGDVQIQKNMNYLLGKQADLRNEIAALKEERRSADWFRARAAAELAEGNLLPETMAVVDELYRKYPSFLEGLKLSVRGGKRAGVEGSFEPIERLVSIFINPFSVTQAETMRHEIMHSLELMMNPDAQRALVSAWGDALGKAIQKHKDPRSQEFFNAVLDYVENPTKANFYRATNKMPNLGFYQYMNPSEFWAVNGEKLMKAQLGTGWNRFVKGVQKILEALKSVFGFDNRYAVHREFDRLMKGESGQMTDTMLAEYIKRADIEIDFLNQVEDVDELLEKHERPNAPLHPSDKLKDRLLQKTESITELFDQYKNNPRLETSKMIGAADRAITYARNKNVWFGTGLELADLKRYNGQLRDDKGFAVASIALTNAVHAGHVGTQVITHGGLRFDPVTQQFTAYDSKYSLANVVREKTKLIAKLGEQRAADVIQAFFEAKRSRSIQNEFYDRQAEFENLKAEFESELDAERKDELYKEMMSAEEDLRRVMVALDKVNMTDEAIDDFIALEKKYPELKEMMRNWTAVNQNMIDNMEFSGIISKKRAERLRAIKDYVPWYRIQDDMADPHDRPAQGVRGLTNVAGEKKFKKGQTDKDIDDIVDNMIHNVMMTTRNSIRNYAANRIAQQYATRNDKGKIKVFPQEGTMKDGAIRVNILANGRRIVVEIKDPLIAESVLGMESIEIPMIDTLAILANGLRRGITSNPIFQVKQLFMDAPTAAWVSGVKNPFKVWGDTFMSFAAALNPNDPIVKMMKNYGIGGYQSSSRTPEKELKMQIGLIGRSPLAYMLKMLDHIGDASDYAQRRAVYKQVLKETGDEMQALLQANNVIDFLKHGSGRAAQATVRTVAFMNAYAQSMDVMAQAMAGGGLKGKERKQVFAQFVKTGMVLASLSLLYSFAIGDDDEYQKMDDQTKVRNFIIPKSMTKYIGMDNSIKVPMHTSASFFFKSVPELLYNKIMNEGTKNHVDNQRLRTALKEAATDALLGPNVTPTGVKPFLEIALNKNFFTGGTITPKGMENLEAFRQYTANTSELGKVISKGTFGLLNPIEADHLIKGLLGTVGAAAMWGSNMFSGDRAEPNASSNPFYGAFVSAPVPRGPEDIYYDLKERSTKVHDTFIDMMKKGRSKEATEYRKENEKLFKAYGYTNGVEQSLKKLNAEIRRVGDLPGEKLSPEEKRERITYYQQKKNDVLKDVIEYRKRAGL